MKIRKIILVIMLLFSVVGCKSGVPNAKRGTNYRYDFADFIKITTFGEDGAGYVDIAPREITVEDFESEQEYIKVKKDLETISPYHIQGAKFKSNITVSKDSGLSNGDVIKISVKVKKEKLESDINIESYQYVVDSLRESKEIDLFSKKNVTFYATDDGKLYYHIRKNGDFSDEMKENLLYELNSTDELIPGEAVMHIKATMDEDFLLDNNYYTLEMYMAKNNLKGEVEVDKVLENVVGPMDMNAASSAGVESAVFDAIYQQEGEALAKICNIQKTPRQLINEPYTYTAVYYTIEHEQRKYYRRDVRMVLVDNEYIVQSVGQRDETKEEFITRPYNESVMLMNFVVIEDHNEIIETPPEENTVPNEEPQG